MEGAVSVMHMYIADHYFGIFFDWFGFYWENVIWHQNDFNDKTKIHNKMVAVESNQ